MTEFVQKEDTRKASSRLHGGRNADFHRNTTLKTSNRPIIWTWVFELHRQIERQGVVEISSVVGEVLVFDPPVRAPFQPFHLVIALYRNKYITVSWFCQEENEIYFGRPIVIPIVRISAKVRIHSSMASGM